MYPMGDLDRCISQYISRYIGRVSTNVSADTPIGGYIWWLTETSPIPLQYFTDTAPILHRYIPSPSVLVDIGRYIGQYIGRHSTDTRVVDKCSSVVRCIGR